MIYLNKEHDTNEKYIIYDNILTPLVAFLNNVLSYQEKRRIMKEYGFNVIDKEFVLKEQQGYIVYDRFLAIWLKGLV